MVLTLLLGRTVEIGIAQQMEVVVLGRSELRHPRGCAILASAWLVPYGIGKIFHSHTSISAPHSHPWGWMCLSKMLSDVAWN